MGNGSTILVEGRSLWDLLVAEVTVLYENRGRTAAEALAFCKAFDRAIDGGCGSILDYIFPEFWVEDPTHDDEVVAESLEMWAGLIETVKQTILLQEVGLRVLLNLDLDYVEVGGPATLWVEFCNPTSGVLHDPEGSLADGNLDDFVIVDGEGNTMTLRGMVQTEGYTITGGDEE